MSIRTFFATLNLWLSARQESSDKRKSSDLRTAHCSSPGTISGYWFCARVRLQTPLAVLEQHGIFHPGPPAQLPLYGAVNEGMWLPVYQSAHSPLPLYVDSDIGPIPRNGGDYLRFVKTFRQIVEAKTSVDATIAQLNALCQRNAIYQGFARQFAPDFVMTWFLNALLLIPGVNPWTAQQLFSAGYRTIEEVAAAPDSLLRDVLHIDDAAMQKLRAFVDEYRQRGGRKTANCSS